MEIEQVENLLDYVFTPGEGDFNLHASVQEYKKLQRIMTVMIRFYKRGSDSKSKQLEQLREEMSKLETDEKMIQEQLKVLEEFPPIHPKRGEYEAQLEEELERLQNQKKLFKPQEDNFSQLYEWSLKIVATVEWLGKQLEAYCNQVRPFALLDPLFHSPYSGVSCARYNQFCRNYAHVAHLPSSLRIALPRVSCTACPIVFRI
jgi:DNA repair ATPase RecN